MSLAGHAWTVLPKVVPAARSVVVPPSRPWSTVVSDPVLGPLTLSGRLHEVARARRLVIGIHGLGGCADSGYLLVAASAAAAAGFSFLRLNLRGADGREGDFYHAGLTSDLSAALASPEVCRHREVHLLGYSLGGHLALRAAAEGELPAVRSVAAICSPLDLAPGAAALDHRARWPYRRFVLHHLTRTYAAVCRHRPQPLPLTEAKRIRFIREWDERIVAPRHGFAGADDYYRRASVAPILDELAVPALLVVAEGDPMVPAEGVRAALAGRSLPTLEVRWVQRGGHVSFPSGLDLGQAGPPGLEAQALAWLSRPRGEGSGRAGAPHRPARESPSTAG